MVQQFSSSPGASDVRNYQAGSANAQTSKTAFQSISNDVLLNNQTLYADPYVKYLSASGDPVNSARYFNELYAGLTGVSASSGSKFNNAWEELQALLRANKYSNGKTPIGIVDSADRTGLAQAIQNSLAMGQTDVIQFLTALSAGGGRGGTGPKQVDTTTRFNTQVTRALQLKDEGDAMRALTDAYMLAYATAPTDEMITDFKKKWNAELKAQTPEATTRNVTVMVPVYDSKTGKQKIGKNGKPQFKPLVNAEGVRQYEPITSSGTLVKGEGFTAEEQQAFMANYLATNFPSQNWNVEEIGGAAKNIYDAMVEVNRQNNEKIPTFAEAAPTITKIIGSGNSEVSNTLIQKYVDDTRAKAAKRYMSIAADIEAGNDAKPIIDRYKEMASTALETTIADDDSLMLSILNFKDEKGNYRLPNDFEMSNLLMNDPRRGYTSAAKNEAVNLAQSLQNQLQIG